MCVCVCVPVFTRVPVCVRVAVCVCMPVCKMTYDFNVSDL